MHLFERSVIGVIFQEEFILHSKTKEATFPPIKPYSRQQILCPSLQTMQHLYFPKSESHPYILLNPSFQTNPQSSSPFPVVIYMQVNPQPSLSLYMCDYSPSCMPNQPAAGLQRQPGQASNFLQTQSSTALPHQLHSGSNTTVINCIPGSFWCSRPRMSPTFLMPPQVATSN